MGQKILLMLILVLKTHKPMSIVVNSIVLKGMNKVKWHFKRKRINHLVEQLEFQMQWMAK